jgi:hypothetical protein
MPPSDADFTSVAEELYAVPAAGFVAERNARAKAARADGDRDLAARITALPKPSVSAWLVNLLVHDDADDLDRVLELSDELRAAQAGGDRPLLRRLGEQRRDLLADVARTTAARAAQQGHAPTAAVLEEFQQTLQAALVDEGAAAAVRTGRLVRALTADGFDPADLTNAVGGPAASAGRARRSGRTAPAPSTAGTAEEAEERRREEAKRRAAAAAERAEDARHAADDAADRAQQADAEVEQRDHAVHDLTERLEELQQQLAAAQHDLDDAEDAARTARAAATEAERGADDAEAEAQELQDALDGGPVGP